MKTKWTPGPWSYWLGSTVFEVGKTDRLIAEINPAGQVDDEDEANARLISLAPEMAEALRAFVEWADGNHYPKGWANPPTLPANMARSLLARLEGGEK